MKLYGLTGGIGMGKTTAAKWFSGQGVPIIDTDVVARELVEPGQPALAEIQAAFGGGVISKDGQLRRDELARLVFEDSPARQRLEGILHPRIRNIWQAQAQSWRAQNIPRAAVVIPLLYETNAAASFDSVICVACAAATQKMRLQARGWDAKQVEQRIASQWPAEKKMELANFVVWTEGSLEVHGAQLERIIS